MATDAERRSDRFVDLMLTGWILCFLSESSLLQFYICQYLRQEDLSKSTFVQWISRRLISIFNIQCFSCVEQSSMWRKSSHGS